MASTWRRNSFARKVKNASSPSTRPVAALRHNPGVNTIPRELRHQQGERLISLPRIGKEELLAADLVGSDGPLSRRREEPFYEGLAELRFHRGVPRRVHQ